MPTWIERLGLFLFPNEGAWDRRRKAQWLVMSVLGSLLLVALVALVTIALSVARHY